MLTHYIALIHKEPASAYGISFPDLPGVVTASDTLDGAISEAANALMFAAEDWEKISGTSFPSPRSLDDLRADQRFLTDSADAVIAAIPLERPLPKAA